MMHAAPLPVFLAGDLLFFTLAMGLWPMTRTHNNPEVGK